MVFQVLCLCQCDLRASPDSNFQVREGVVVGFIVLV